MGTETIVAADSDDYRIEIEIPDEPAPGFEGKMLVGCGEIGSGLDTPGFGKQVADRLGVPYAALKQRNRTQYQYLTREVVTDAFSRVAGDYDLYFYGTSIGGYSAAYYSRPLGANFLALSPRLPTHPITNRRIAIGFKTPGYLHAAIYSGDAPSSAARRVVLLDRENTVDDFYVRTDLAVAYPDLEVHHVANAGHYTPRALLLSGMLKSVVVEFLQGRPLTIDVNDDAILAWNEERFYLNLERKRFGHASEHLEVLLRNQSPEQIEKHVRAMNEVATLKRA